ncbi:MAG: chemotaxis response regulator protein-glutamate methylesterase [Cyanobacteriota bacterium]
MKKIKVLVIDDSALSREIISTGLAQDPVIEVIGTASDVYIARDKIVKLKPDVLTLDIEMPGMDGLEFLKRLMPQYPIPVVVVSSLTQKGKEITLNALSLGAVDFIPKPSSGLAKGLSGMLIELRTKIKLASSANVAFWKDRRKVNYNDKKESQIHILKESTDKVIAIGASTGGTEAIRRILSKLPANMPGIVIVQHMPPGFTKMFAESLNNITLMDVKEAKSDDRIMQGKVLIAPGDFQLKVVRTGGIYKTVCEKGDKVNGHCPSIDVFMKSVAENVGSNAYGVLLTGMGKDGANGLKMMRDSGSRNIAQDEETSVVFGMPKVAWEIGAVEKLLPIETIATYLINLIKKN